jgi:hypothetical protein
MALGERDSSIFALLEYYTNLAMHHRTMMIAFLTVYFGITQFLLLTPPASLEQIAQNRPTILALSAGLLATFVLSATMHHACHFCSTAGLRALMAAEAHYMYLPEKANPQSKFLTWITETARQVRQGTAVTSYSVAILASLFTVLVVINTAIFVDSVKSLFGPRHFDYGFAFAIFLAIQAAILLKYGATFRRHFKYLVRSRDELKLVLNSTSRQQVDERIDALKGRPPHASPITERILFHDTHPSP